MCVRKFCMRYILNEQFWLNISRVISKSVRRELTFLVECISIQFKFNLNLSPFSLSEDYIIALSSEAACISISFGSFNPPSSYKQCRFAVKYMFVSNPFIVYSILELKRIISLVNGHYFVLSECWCNGLQNTCMYVHFTDQERLFSMVQRV